MLKFESLIVAAIMVTVLAGCGSEKDSHVVELYGTPALDDSSQVVEAYQKALSGDKSHIMVNSAGELQKIGIINAEKTVLNNGEFFHQLGKCSIKVKKIVGDVAFVDQECDKKAFGVSVFATEMKKDNGVWKIPLLNGSAK